MEQLMTRKQKAEEIVWGTIHDVLYLRTGNGNGARNNKQLAAPGCKLSGQFGIGKGDDSVVLHDSDDAPSDDEESTSSQLSQGKNDGAKTVYGWMIANTLLDEELDLEEDEIRCMEDGVAINDHLLPRYQDATLALRLLIESLDDVERYLNESVKMEVRRMAEREQTRTYNRLEKKKGRRTTRQRSLQGTEKKKPQHLPLDVRNHLKHLLGSFGNVMLRLSRLAQILRQRIKSDPLLLTPSYSDPSSALASVLASAHNCMQLEIKAFLRSCLEPSGEDAPLPQSQARNPAQFAAFDPNAGEATDRAQGIFSLGVVDRAVHPVDAKADAKAKNSSRGSGRWKCPRSNSWSISCSPRPIRDRTSSTPFPFGERWNAGRCSARN